MLKKILLGLGAALVLIQFVRPAKNLSAGPAPGDITALYPTPPDVKAVLAKACYDCHSDHTRYPWYAEVQPVGWWLAEHVKDGKRHLNFSRFDTYPPFRAARALTKSMHEVEEHEMPLGSYTLIHRDAILTADEIAAFDAWARGIRDQLEAAK
jgi:hypothetical protein